MRYVIDVDGTICTQETMNYYEAQPLHNRIQKINKWYDEGNEIIFFTARGNGTGIDWYDVTKEQLNKWGVKHHKLIMGKPWADYYIDDKAVVAEMLDKE